MYCNLRDFPSKTPPYDPLPGLIRLHEQKAIAENALISWGGGESSILPGFEQAAEWALSSGCPQNIHTNASSHSPVIQNLLELGRGTMDISLDSATPKMYKSVKRVEAFTKVRAPIERYSQANSKKCYFKIYCL